MLAPEKHTFDTIWGHDVARRYVPRLLSVGRLPHAILLTGPDGLGKRSLAFAMAKAILSAGKPVSSSTMSLSPSNFAVRNEGDDGDVEDLFGAEDDLFAAADEPDLFGDALEPEPEKEQPPPPPQKADPPPVAEKPEKPAAPKPAKGKKSPPRRKEQHTHAAEFRGFDERVCRLVEANYEDETTGHVDLTIIEPRGRSRNILVDQIRSLQDITSRSPVEGRFRVVLVFGADTITQEGGNSILKLLEEPPGYLVMILVANQLHRVIPTIRSRCSLVRLSPLAQDELARHLVEKEKMEGDLARVAAALAEGRPGAALNVVKSKMLDQRRAVFQARLQMDRFGLPALANSSSRLSQAGNLEEVLWLMMSYARDRMVHQVAPGKDQLLVHGDVPDLLEAGKAGLEALDEEADRLVSAYGQLRHPFIPNDRAILQLALWPED
ncbi:MAG: hypothetical protein JJU11_08355 [Candidatus Sumerlaeia bacterium]|nr:hypothetical protein [Candidatus Sumerlaeia bacterium]